MLDSRIWNVLIMPMFNRNYFLITFLEVDTMKKIWAKIIICIAILLILYIHRKWLFAAFMGAWFFGFP